MLLALGLTLALQTSAQDTRRLEDSITKAVMRRVNERAEQRAIRPDPTRPVTPELLASAFKDPGARTLLGRARRARSEQDSTLVSYDATAYQRISASLAFTKLGRDRLIFRTEHSGRVRWSRDVGIWINVTGARTVIPGVPEIGEREAGKGLAESGEMLPVPYYPGYEPLWAGADIMRDTVTELGPIHPLAEGSEAYYTYRTGDSLSFRLPDGKVVRLRALDVRPREPKWNVVVGTLLFDVATAQLVRAAYRFAVPMHIDAFVREQDPTAFDDVPVWIKPVIFPMRGEISVVTVEYGLYEGRFWLPRMRTAEGHGQASFVRVPFRMEQSFKYASVNGPEVVPGIQLPVSVRPPDSLSAEARQAWRDSVRAVRAAAALARRDSIRRGFIPARRITQCDTSEFQTSMSRFGQTRIPLAVRSPCNVAALETSPDLPASIFDPGDELFDAAARDALIGEALAMGAQPPLTLRLAHLPKPVVAYGAQLMRYNRVEGLSAGLGVTQLLGGGYSVDAIGRIATAHWRPDVELTVARSNLSRAMYLAGYDHLRSASDWGNPLSFGSSVSGLLFGRDEGFYYRARGAALGMRRERGAPLDARLFLEKHRAAPAQTELGLLASNEIPNIGATADVYGGGTLRFKHTRGVDPQGFRIFTDLRLEAASGDSLYGRGALDLTFAEGIGALAVAVTVSGGSSIGALPAHRRWYLGGTHTVRGQRPDTAANGTAFWLTRTEAGRMIQGSRVLVFGDIGWAGDRTNVRSVGRPMSGAGVGFSMLDGLLRFDVAKGINPGKGWRVDAYIEGVF